MCSFLTGRGTESRFVFQAISLAAEEDLQGNALTSLLDTGKVKSYNLLLYTFLPSVLSVWHVFFSLQLLFLVLLLTTSLSSSFSYNFSFFLFLQLLFLLVLLTTSLSCYSSYNFSVLFFSL